MFQDIRARNEYLPRRSDDWRGFLEILLQSSIVPLEGRMKKENYIGKDEVKKVFKYFFIRLHVGLDKSKKRNKGKVNKKHTWPRRGSGL